MQVNNIKIKRVREGKKTKWVCVSPDGRWLEEFRTQKAALDWACKTTDFIMAS